MPVKMSFQPVAYSEVFLIFRRLYNVTQAMVIDLFVYMIRLRFTIA